MRSAVLVSTILATIAVPGGCGQPPPPAVSGPNGQSITVLTSCAGDDAPEWVNTTNALVAEDRTAVAAEIYRAVLARSPTDTCAVRGLAALAVVLGSSPPAGLKFPRDTDVTALPADALTTLPETAVSKLLFSVGSVMRPGIPWRAEVGMIDASTLTVSLSRNGHLAGPVVTLTRTGLELPALAEGTRAWTPPDDRC